VPLIAKNSTKKSITETAIIKITVICRLSIIFKDNIDLYLALTAFFL
jgi:hypothetical protein